MSQILLVDDDLELCRMLEEYLQLEGFDVTSLHRGDEVPSWLSHHPTDLVILDVMMPGLNGFDTLKQLREHWGIPVLMMSARGEEVDRILGLEMGADDYLPKPCSPRELLARIRANLRRVALDNGPDTPLQLQLNGVELDLDSLSASYQGHPLALTQTEFTLLRLLMEAQGKLVTRDALMQQALNRRQGPYDRTIDMHLSNIRRKLGDAHPAAVEIRTVRGAGYRLVKGRSNG